jgi:predicted Zn-ribbon and HTH transcriptional regulator
VTGEAFGLRKEDVDTRTWTLAVRHSWLAPLPKDGDARDVTIVSELRPLLEAAMRASPSEWVFVQADVTPYTPNVRFHLVDHLRRALKRAGVVEGYRHICRRKGCGFEELRPAAEEARCPKCNMRLWVSPIPRKLRFYDLPHPRDAAPEGRRGPGRRAAQPRPLLARDHGRRVRPQRPGGLPGGGRPGADLRRAVAS